jgi:hypothetical protein
MMKICHTLFLVFFAAACSNQINKEATLQNFPLNNRKQALIYDSLLLHHKDYKLIIQDFENGLSSKEDDTSFPRDVITLSSGEKISFATSNNLRVRETVSRLPEISPAELLIELRNIKGEIKFQREILEKNWIQREHFPELIMLAEIDVTMPMISLLTPPPAGSDCVETVCLLKYSYALAHITIGYEALHMMKIYLKVGGGYPFNIRNDLSLMKEWYSSGKPREEYKSMLDERMAGQ